MRFIYLHPHKILFAFVPIIMTFLSKRINNLSESQTIKMAKLGRELSAKGIDVINLSFGEPDFFTPEFVKEAAKDAVDENYSYYTPVSGYPELRKAVAEKLLRENGLSYNFDQIVVSTGAKQSLANAVMCLVDPGDEVIVPTPYWVSYSEMIKLGEGETVFINATVENNFKITGTQLEAAITAKTKLFMFSSPCNPTGSVYSKEELADLVAVFEKHPKIFIISDEIYEHINFVGKHASIAEFESIKDRVILINGFSKSYAMTGWRVGYMASNKEIANACDKLQGQITSGTSSIAQRAALAAYNGGLDTVKVMVDEFKKRRDIVYALLTEIPGVKVNLPDGAFYFFPEIKSFFGKRNGDSVINSAEDLSLYLLNEAHVSTVTGEAFGNEDCIRLSYAASEEQLRKAVTRIKDALAKLS